MNNNECLNTTQEMKFSTKDFFSKCEHRSFLRICSHLPKKSLMENYIFRAVKVEYSQVCTSRRPSSSKH